MPSEWKIEHLIKLVRRRYPQWSDFAHPPFVADETDYKRETVAKAADLLCRSELDRLLAEEDYETFTDRLLYLARDNNLLWQNVPSAGDTAVLHHDALEPAPFCTQMRNLLYGDRPTHERLQTFSDFLRARKLPNKWTFPTYYLFLCHPDREMFVKPNTAEWFLKFMGETISVRGAPEGDVYATLLRYVHQLRGELVRYAPQDMIDLQSFVWVAFREGKARTGRLNARGQIDLDVPPTVPEEDVDGDYAQSEAETAVLAESSAAYNTRHTSPPYPLEQLAAETGISEEELTRWKTAVARKGQAIFYGPPGTGKTFLAQKLAQHLVGGGNGFWQLIQFHPTYAYEDFVQGIRPLAQQDGRLRYELANGRFLSFCAAAATRSDPCVLIVDEINRANLAAVFGELMYLLEYREAAVPLAAGGTFHIPDNVRILGTMNTADRSIALVDHALRRRFAFIHLAPNYDLLRRFHAESEFDPGGLITLLQRLNRQIDDPHYAIGHTFFLHKNLSAQLADIWQMEIEPYLEEYFFDQPDRVEAFRWSQIETAVLPAR